MGFFGIRLSREEDTLLGYLIDYLTYCWLLGGVAPLKIEDIVCQEGPLLSHVLRIIELFENTTSIVRVPRL